MHSSRRQLQRQAEDDATTTAPSYKLVSNSTLLDSHLLVITIPFEHL